ncbi:hypothetical protein QQ045_001238 [Rhodiola kirilowii]
MRSRMEEEKKRMKTVCGVVFVLLLLSVATGIGAESMMRAKNSEVDEQCEYSSNSVFPLGIIAAWALASAHAIINLETGICCCRGAPRPSASNWILAPPFCFLSWFTFVGAFVSLVTGANPIGLYIGDITDTCYEVNPGVFLRDAGFSFVCVSCGMVYYLILYAATTISTAQVIPPNQAGVELGQA